MSDTINQMRKRVGVPAIADDTCGKRHPDWPNVTCMLSLVHRGPHGSTNLLAAAGARALRRVVDLMPGRRCEVIGSDWHGGEIQRCSGPKGHRNPHRSLRYGPGGDIWDVAWLGHECGDMAMLGGYLCTLASEHKGEHEAEDPTGGPLRWKGRDVPPPKPESFEEWWT